MVKFLDYSVTNVHSDSYTVLDPSAGNSSSGLMIVDNSGQLMKLAIGPKGKEIDLCAFQGNGQPLQIKSFIKQGDRVCVRALVSPATQGQIAVSYL